MSSVLRPAVFMDRDGILNEHVYDELRRRSGPPLWPEQLTVKREAPGVVAALNGLGYLCIVVTNQPAIARKLATVVQVDRVHRRLRDELASKGARLDGIFFCPHDPDPGPGSRPVLAPGCACHMPAPGMILDAAAVHNVDLDRSFMLTATLGDVEAGRAAGLTTLLLSPADTDLGNRIRERPDARPDRIVAGLREALDVIADTRERLIAEHRG